MARFIIVDLTDPKSIPQELTAIIPDHPSIPIQPIILSSQLEYAMYEHWQRYPWVLSIYRYDSIEDIVCNLANKVILPAENALAINNK
jgi:hypothetical protein